MTVRYLLPGFSLDKNHTNPVLYFIIKGMFYRYVLRGVLPTDASHSIADFSALFSEIRQHGDTWLRLTDKSLAKLMQETITFQEFIMNDGAERALELIEALTRSFCTRDPRTTPRAKLYEIPSVPNLRFYPTCTRFDAAEFKDQMLHSTGYDIIAGILISRLSSRGLIDAWVEMAQKWVEEGV
jgi:signal-transduction protein with cAMP-binding, CBS, and nucleotidyltransferase domain